MAYRITAETDQIILVKFNGTVDLAERKRARDEAISLCKKRDCSRVLLDMRDCKMNLSMSDIFNFVDSTCRSGEVIKFRIGGVTNFRDEVNKLIQVFLSTRGIDMHIFYNKDNALKWLMASKPLTI